uniref:Uncharacterized protein n=1 Tax=Trichogramma kaykai TaxID=54128 RepID=A0ABD2VRF2_9HYME
MGVVLSSDLTWGAHLSQISSRVHCTLHRLRARAWLLSPGIKKLLVQALVLPHLDYACLVYNNVPASLNLKLQRLANAGVRFIFNMRGSDHSSVTLRREQLGWSRVEDRSLIRDLEEEQRQQPPKAEGQQQIQLQPPQQQQQPGGATLEARNSCVVIYLTPLTHKETFSPSGHGFAPKFFWGLLVPYTEALCA